MSREDEIRERVEKATAIPDPTEKDWEMLEYYTNDLLSNPDIEFEFMFHEQNRRWLRLLAHFQRENERLTRQRDVLRLPFKLNHFCVEMAEKIMAGADGSISQGDADGFRDALTGEGGAA